MILLEFAAQGVRGVAPAGGRATLRPGYNVVSADGPALRRLLEALLYPDPKDADALPRAPVGPAGAALRAGLTLVGNDRATYRLVRDFAAGCQLHRFDAEKRSFALVSSELAPIRAFLEKTVGVPPAGRLAALLSVTAAELPSRQAGPALVGGAPGPARPSLSPEGARKRLAALRGELEKAKVAEKLQEQLDVLQSRLFKLEEGLKGGAKLEEGLEKALGARRELDQAAEVAAALGDAEAKVTAFERAAARRDEALAKIAAEREGTERAESAGLPRPFWIDPLFWAGAAPGLAVALVGWAGASAHSDLRYVALLAIPAFGWAAWRALHWVAALEAGERSVRRRRIVDEWEKKVLAQFERDASEVRGALLALGVTKAEDLRDALGRVADADQVVAEWRRRVSEWQGSDEARGALAEKEKVEQELREVEAKLVAEAGGFIRDVRSVEAEIQRLEAEAAAGPEAVVAAPPPPRAAGEPIRTLLERAALELGGTPTSAARAVAQRASAALAGLSFQRLQSLQADERGNVQVQAGGRAVAALSLSPADRDLVYLALKVAFLEQALAAGKTVAVADDAFAGLSEGSRRFAARLLKQVARPGQLLHATTDSAFREAADHAA